MNKEKCFDIGVIQAFIDGELASDLQENVIGHIAWCDSCATLLAETEGENAYAFSVLDDELNVLVPTERLRTKVFASIEEAKEKVGLWQTVTESLGLAGGFSFKSPSLVAFASVVLFVSVLAIGVNFYEPMPNGEVAGVYEPPVSETQVEFPTFPNGNDTPTGNPVAKDINDNEVADAVFSDSSTIRQRNSNDVRVIKAGGIERSGSKIKPKKVVDRTEPKTPRQPEVEAPKPPVPGPDLDGEDSYLQTISTLKRTVDFNKDMALRPKERIAYEKDMAMVDNAIKQMKAEVRKNPKNKAAREILRASYQNKINLLISVAEKTQLMASIE